MSARCRVVVLTFNCETIIAQTLAQARKLDPLPFVVDSFSSDGTLQQIGLGAVVVQRAFQNYAEQRNWAIGQIAPEAEWQLHLDADEVLDDAAVAARLVLAPRATRLPAPSPVEEIPAPPDPPDAPEPFQPAEPPQTPKPPPPGSPTPEIDPTADPAADPPPPAEPPPGALDDLVVTGPTYTNVNDFRAILVM